MKKVFTIILSSFILFGLLGCANSSGGSSTEKSSVIAKATTDGIEITVPKVAGVNRYGIDRENLTTGKYDSWYMAIYREPNKINFTDYFVQPGNEYKYTVHFRTEDNQGRDKLKASSNSEKATKGCGELKSIKEPEATYSNNKLTFTVLPEFSANVLALFGRKSVEKNSFYIEYALGNNDSALQGNITDRNLDCVNAMKNDNAFGKDLNLRRLKAEFTMDGVQYRYYSHWKNEMPGMPQTINVEKK